MLDKLLKTVDPALLARFAAIVGEKYAIRDAHASHLGPALIRQAINDGRRTGHLTLDEAEQLEQELLGTNPRRQNRRTRSIRGDAA